MNAKCIVICLAQREARRDRTPNSSGNDLSRRVAGDDAALWRLVYEIVRAADVWRPRGDRDPSRLTARWCAGAPVSSSPVLTISPIASPWCSVGYGTGVASSTTPAIVSCLVPQGQPLPAFDGHHPLVGSSIAARMATVDPWKIFPALAPNQCGRCPALLAYRLYGADIPAVDIDDLTG